MWTRTMETSRQCYDYKPHGALQRWVRHKCIRTSEALIWSQLQMKKRMCKQSMSTVKGADQLSMEGGQKLKK